MWTPILIAWLALPGIATAISPARTRHPSAQSPYVQIWTNRDDVLHRGDKVRVYFRTATDGYVTVFRIDTDGRVRVLFPVGPWDDNYARGGAPYQVDPRDDGYTFRVDDYPGQGYVFAIASLDPFLYTRYVRNDHWDYEALGADGRVAGDPYVAIYDVIDGVVPDNYVDYAYDVAPYFVEEHYDYPRFLCYTCHAYAPYPYWDPYGHSCSSYRIVIYDDPYYYPAHAYGATRVVYRPPVAPVPRYVFKDRSPNDDYVARVRERPVDQGGRRLIDPGATRRDLPGGHLLPTPRSPQAAPTADPGRRAAPGSTGGTAPASTPTLERRDPGKAPAVPATRRSPAGTSEPAKTQPSTTSPTRRGAPTNPPAKADGSTRPAAQPPKAQPDKGHPSKAPPPKTDDKHSTPPPKRRG